MRITVNMKDFKYLMNEKFLALLGDKITLLEFIFWLLLMPLLTILIFIMLLTKIEVQWKTKE